MANGLTMTETIKVLLRAKYPIVAVYSSEEHRVESALKQVARQLESEIRFWSCTTGITDGEDKALAAEARALPTALDYAMKKDERAIYVYRDPHPFLADAAVRRKVRDAAGVFKRTPTPIARSAIFLTPGMSVHPDLKSCIHVERWPLPGRDELLGLLRNTVDSLPATVINRIPKYDVDRVVSAALGLTVDEAHNAFSRSLVEKVALDPALILQEKKQVVMEKSGVEWLDALPGGLGSVGGLEVLKVWLEQRRKAFSPAARARGLPFPKGIFLAGMMGCGKTLVAKAIASAWDLALLRLSIAGLFGGTLGESEGNLRRAIETAEAVAPCVLLIDEIDKAVGGGGGERDGGTASRIRGELLTWLAERKSEVFAVASANNVEQLAETSPELLRKGRWDELFFVQLPSPAEIRSILQVHCDKRKIALKGKVDLVVQQMSGFSGAEIEAVVVDADFRAFADNERAVSVQDLMHEAKRTVPISKTAARRVTALKEWGAAHARSASLEERATSGLSAPEVS